MKEYPKMSTYLVALAMLYVTMYVASYPVAYKIITFGPFIETGAIFLFPLCYTIGDIVAELYGYKKSRQIVWLSICCGAVFCFSIIGIINLPSPFFWKNEPAYLSVLQPMYKIFIAMTTATTIGVLINLFLINKWRILLRGRYFWLRSIGASSLGELAFSIIAGLIAFVGVEPADKIIWLILNGWLLKVIYAVAMSGPATFIVSLVRHLEGVKLHNKSGSYNPFRKT